MMGSVPLAATLAAIAGLAGAAQIAGQGRLSDRIGTVEALACASVIGGLISLLVLLATRRSFDGLARGAAGPKWMLLGGVMSAVIILSITVAGPRIGVVATTAVLIAAQFGLGAAIDRVGWFGIEAIPLSWSRIAGLVLPATGAALTLRR
jgi:transporter family-2 protein